MDSIEPQSIRLPVSTIATFVDSPKTNDFAELFPGMEMLLNNGLPQFEAESLAEQLSEMYFDGGCYPFPYDDCRWLREEFDSELDLLIPNLDLWMSDIAGLSSRGKILLRLGKKEILLASGLMSLGFFEKHPEYAGLRRHITRSNTPNLLRSLELYEKMRNMLISLLERMLLDESKIE